MATWRLTIRYDGARYKGWQRLGKEDGGSSIQGKLEAVFATLCGEEVLVTGSGRTDAGVHALAQVAHFRTTASLSSQSILAHAARYLPDDIAVTTAEEADDRFHARYQVKEKIYLYRVDTGLWPDPFERKYAWHIPEPLDFKSMTRAAQELLGEHDFSAFTTMKSKKKSYVKTLKSIDIQKPTNDGSIMRIRLIADGFLHNMVRIIVGTLIEVGREERDAHSLRSLVEGGLRSEAGTTAPAKGLFLERAEYDTKET
jgi:tRNA pseudouridine38-40 synthase